MMEGVKYQILEVLRMFVRFDDLTDCIKQHVGNLETRRCDKPRLPSSGSPLTEALNLVGQQLFSVRREEGYRRDLNV